MNLRLQRAVHAGAVLAYSDPERALAALAHGWLPPAMQVRAARRLGRRVLEYGCGTGRVTIALARAGLEVTAVDLSQAMLAHLAASLAGEPASVRARVRLRHGDMRDLELGERFPLVLVPDGTFQHLYDADDVRGFLTRVRQHLSPGGRLRLDVELPNLRLLAAPPPATTYLPLPQILLRALDGDPNRLLAERQYFPAELRALLARAGAHRQHARVLPAPHRKRGSPAARLVLQCSWDAGATGAAGRGPGSTATRDTSGATDPRRQGR